MHGHVTYLYISIGRLESQCIDKTQSFKINLLIHNLVIITLTSNQLPDPKSYLKMAKDSVVQKRNGHLEI